MIWVRFDISNLSSYDLYLFQLSLYSKFCGGVGDPRSIQQPDQEISYALL